MNDQLLFNNNLELAYKIASRFYSRSYIDQDDIKQLALIALWEAARGYKESIKVKFSTYAYTVIKNFLIKELSKLTNITRGKNINFVDLGELEEVVGDDVEAVERGLIMYDTLRDHKTFTKRELTVMSKVLYGDSLTDIGGYFGSSVQAVSATFNKALYRLAMR